MVISIRLFSIIQLELQTPETMKKKINRQNQKNWRKCTKP